MIIYDDLTSSPNPPDSRDTRNRGVVPLQGVTFSSAYSLQIDFFFHPPEHRKVISPRSDPFQKLRDKETVTVEF